MAAATATAADKTGLKHTASQVVLWTIKWWILNAPLKQQCFCQINDDIPPLFSKPQTTEWVGRTNVVKIERKIPEIQTLNYTCTEYSIRLWLFHSVLLLNENILGYSLAKQSRAQHKVKTHFCFDNILDRNSQVTWIIHRLSSTKNVLKIP